MSFKKKANESVAAKYIESTYGDDVMIEISRRKFRICDFTLKDEPKKKW